MRPTPSSQELEEVVQYNHPSAPQIGRWVRHNVLNVTDENGRCTKFVVRHLTVNKKANGDVGEIRVPENIAEINGIDHLIDQICDAAQQDANAMREGVQTYGVFAYFARNRDYSPRTFFRVSAEDSFDHDAEGGDPSEPPTDKGITSQLMRHCEALTRSNTIHSSNIIEILMRDNASQRALIERQMAQSMDFAAVIQESMDNATARRIAEKDAAAKAELTGSMIEHVKVLIPVIINKLAGQKITPETDASFTLLASLFESLTSEQQQRLFTELLNPSQAAVLAEFVDTYEKRKRTLTSKPADTPKSPLNLGLMFDKTSDRLRTMDPTQSGDTQLTAMETKAKSFKDAFSRPLPTIGLPFRPAPEKKP
jgi:hypothetical protein